MTKVYVLGILLIVLMAFLAVVLLQHPLVPHTVLQ